MVTLAIMAAGGAAVALVWRLVAAGRVQLIPAMAVAVGTAAVAALATGRVDLSPRLRPIPAAALGLASGVGLYLATLAFVLLVRRWGPFERHVADLYDQRRGFPLWPAVAVAALVVAPAEEVFWRGLFQGRAAGAAGWAAGSALAWAAYVGANAFSGSLPILAGAVVSGAVWSGLALWTHGVLAGAFCHAIWTGLMILRPPVGHGPAGRAGSGSTPRPLRRERR